MVTSLYLKFIQISARSARKKADKYNAKGFQEYLAKALAAIEDEAWREKHEASVWVVAGAVPYVNGELIKRGFRISGVCVELGVYKATIKSPDPKAEAKFADGYHAVHVKWDIVQ